MKIIRFVIPLLLLFVIAPTKSCAQARSGSDGSMREFRLADTISRSIHVLQLPPSGQLHFTRVYIGTNWTLRFAPNSLNTPVYLLSQTDIIVAGNIDVSSPPFGPGAPDSTHGGIGGPGGFGGGEPAIGTQPPGDGHGPGGGKADPRGSTAPGLGSYSTRVTPQNAMPSGEIYGQESLVPLVGGSGGGGYIGFGGSGGGGAILLAANDTIEFRGNVGVNANSTTSSSFGYGSGGAIRLCAFRLRGSPNLSVLSSGGAGRIRFDRIEFSEFSPNIWPGGSPMPWVSTGGSLIGIPGIGDRPEPTLQLVHLTGPDIGTVPIPPGAIFNHVLPFNANPANTVRVRIANFQRNVNLRVAVIPDSGDRQFFDLRGVANPVGSTDADIPVVLPRNIPISLEAWTF